MRSLRPVIGLLVTLILVSCSVEERAPLAIQPDKESIDLPQKPNIVLIVADDLGYSDIGPYGGEIETPNLDTMAEQGVRFSRFYTANTCAPTRTMLMSGVDNHLAGYGSQGNAENQEGQPGYEGFLNQQVVALPNYLKDAGYHTYMVGKWHLGSAPDQVPSARGFDQTFALMDGGASYFSDMTGPFGVGKVKYMENGSLVESLPDNFYATHFYTDRAIEQIDSNLGDGKPFFTYIALTTPHFPLHAPESSVDKYQGKYDRGFNQLKIDRFESLKSEGLIPADAVMPNNNPESDHWHEFTEEQKRSSSRAMEVYAAMVDDLDQQIGRVISYLKSKGEYENTVFIFMSDNGADPTSDRVGLTMFAQLTARYNNTPENMGRPGSWIAYGHNWAESSMAAFSLYKSESAEGGVRVPVIAHWPGVTQNPATNHGLTNVTDILPTLLDIAGYKISENNYKNREIIEPQGKSLVPVITGQSESIRTADEYIGIEHWSSRAIIQQDWKLLGLYTGLEGRKDWELYNISADPGETNNLAHSNPEKLQEMIGLWDEYVATNGVILAEPGVPALMPSAGVEFIPE